MILLLAGCRGVQSTLETRGPAAAEIASLWWWMLALTLIPATITIVLAIYAALRRRSHEAGPPDARRRPLREQRIVMALALGAVPLILLAILGYSVVVGRLVHTAPSPPRVTVEVVGHQFWWEVRYPDFGVVDANELHLPAGEPVAVRVTSADVIHSFWVPNLHGKIDMFPGRYHDIWLQADEPGVFRGQCAEFCGVQHALMAFEVVAHPREDFDAWIAAARESAVPTDDPLVRDGQDVFFAWGCDECHAIRGITPPSAVTGTGPDLTHVASRRTLAAGTLPNNRGNLYGWILDPQSHKPGSNMPATRIPPREMDALIAFLEALR